MDFNKEIELLSNTWDWWGEQDPFFCIVSQREVKK